jgi:serine/threonine-protein kinase RsbT
MNSQKLWSIWVSAEVSSQISIHISNVVDVSTARRCGMDTAIDMGFERADATKIAAAISELARNILVYAGKGTVTIITNPAAAPPYVTIIASDNGPGIEDLNLAMTDHWTSSGGLGLGLSGSKRLMDDFSVESEVGQGTTVTATKWLK